MIAMITSVAMIISHGQAVSLIWSSLAIAIIGAFASYFVGRRHGRQDGEIQAFTCVNSMLDEALAVRKAKEEAARLEGEREAKVVGEAMAILMPALIDKMQVDMDSRIMEYAMKACDKISSTTSTADADTTGRPNVGQE